MADEMDAATRAGFIAELGFAEGAVQAAGYETTLVEPDDPTVVPELVVILSQDDKDRPRLLHLSFIPTGDDVEHISFLQMYAPLPFTAPLAALADVRQAVAIVNEAVAIGRFGVHEDGTLYYRYVLASPPAQLIDDDMLGELVSFVDFHQENFGDYLEGICEGELRLSSLAKVIEQAG